MRARRETQSGVQPRDFTRSVPTALFLSLSLSFGVDNKIEISEMYRIGYSRQRRKWQVNKEALGVLDARNYEFYESRPRSYLSSLFAKTFCTQTQVEFVNTIEGGSGHYEKLEDLARI